MDYQIEMRYYLTQLQNCFLHKNRSGLLESFHEFAVSNKAIVMDALIKVNPEESEVFWNFIESVCDDSDDWSDFLCSEFNRLLIAAEKMKDPSPVISSLEAFHILRISDNQNLKTEIKNIIKKFIKTRNYPLKRFLVWFFSMCVKDFDATEAKLIKNLRFDNDVIVRYYAFLAYNSYKGFPADHGISDIDKMMIDISDIYMCEPLI